MAYFVKRLIQRGVITVMVDAAAAFDFLHDDSGYSRPQFASGESEFASPDI